MTAHYMPTRRPTLRRRLRALNPFSPVGWAIIGCLAFWAAIAVLLLWA